MQHVPHACRTLTCTSVQTWIGSNRREWWVAIWPMLLRTIYRQRSHGKQFYISQVPNVRNPKFDHEPAYATVNFPDAGYQLLALYRFWNIVNYWYPNRNLLDQDWGQVLAEFIPKIALARTKDAYQLEFITLIARVTDTHANLWSAPPQFRPPVGACQLPVTTRFIENRAVVTGYSEATAGPATGLRVGDVIESLDDVPGGRIGGALGTVLSGVEPAHASA